MKVYITRKPHYGYKYLVQWQNPDDGRLMHDWFGTLKEIAEYIAHWSVVPSDIIKVNF